MVEEERSEGLQPSTSGGQDIKAEAQGDAQDVQQAAAAAAAGNAGAKKPPLPPKQKANNNGGGGDGSAGGLTLAAGQKQTPRKTKKPGNITQLNVNPGLVPLGMGSPHSMEISTPKKRRCNCKQSRCLKLYCECFASGIYCNDCNCQDCYNNKENEQVRQEAVEATLERNPDAFRPKIQSMSPGMSLQDSLKHNKGCNCKRSFCLKRYCECFQADIYCSDNCRCVDCKNFEGSASRAQLLQSPSSRLQSAYSAGMSPRAKRAKTSKSGANGKVSGKNGNNSGEGLLSDPYQTSADMLARIDTSTGEGLSGKQAQALGAAANVAGMSQLINQQMLLPRSMLAGVINENVVKHLSTLLCMVAQEKEEKLKQQIAATPSKKITSGDGNADTDAAQDAQPELSDTLTDTEKDVAMQEAEEDQQNEGESTQLEKTLLCEEEPQGLFELDSPKHGYPNLSKNSLQTASGSKSKQQSDQQTMSKDTMEIDNKLGGGANLSTNEQDAMVNNAQNTRGRGGSQSGNVSKGQGTPHQIGSNNVSQVYVEQERAILQELNNCLQVVSQMGRQQAEYVRFILSPVVPAMHMLNTPTTTANPSGAQATNTTAADTTTLTQPNAEE